METPTVEFCPGLYAAVLSSVGWLLSVQLFIPLRCPLYAACCLSSCSYRCAALCTLTVVCPAVPTAVLLYARWLLSVQLFLPLCCPLHADCCLSSCSYRCAALCTLTVVCPHIMQVSSTTNPFCRSYGSVVAKPGTCEGSVLCQEQGLVIIPTLTPTLSRHHTIVLLPDSYPLALLHSSSVFILLFSVIRYYGLRGRLCVSPSVTRLDCGLTGLGWNWFNFGPYIPVQTHILHAARVEMCRPHTHTHIFL